MLARQAGDVSLDHRKGSTVDPSVLKALREGEEQGETESQSTNSVKEEEKMAISIKEDNEDAAADEDEDEDEDEAEVEAEVDAEVDAETEAEVEAETEAEAEAEAEDDEEEEEEAEDEDDDDDDDDDEKSPQVVNQRTEVETTDETIPVDVYKNPVEIEIKKEWPELPPPPLKGILIAPGFRFVLAFIFYKKSNKIQYCHLYLLCNFIS